MDPQPLDPRSIDWDRELPRSRRTPPPSRRRLWIALGVVLALIGVGGAFLLGARGSDVREVAHTRRAADLTGLRVRQVELTQGVEQMEGALRSYAVEHPGDVDAVKYAADPDNKIDLSGDPWLVASSEDLDSYFRFLITKPTGIGVEIKYQSNIRAALTAARGVLYLRAARQELGQVERDIAALGEKP